MKVVGIAALASLAALAALAAIAAIAAIASLAAIAALAAIASLAALAAIAAIAALAAIASLAAIAAKNKATTNNPKFQQLRVFIKRFSTQFLRRTLLIWTIGIRPLFAEPRIVALDGSTI